MPEKSPLKRKYKAVVEKARENTARYTAWTMIKLTPPAGGGTRTPMRAVRDLRDRVEADIPRANRIAEAVCVGGKAVRIKNNGWTVKNVFVSPGGKSGREARRKLVPATKIFEQLSYFDHKKYHSGGRASERPLRRWFRDAPAPTWVRATDWDAQRRKHIAASGGLLAAWAPVVTALKVPLRLPAAKKSTHATAGMRFNPSARQFTLNFRSTLEPNGVPRMSMVRRALTRNLDFHNV